MFLEVPGFLRSILPNNTMGGAGVRLRLGNVAQSSGCASPGRVKDWFSIAIEEKREEKKGRYPILFSLSDVMRYPGKYSSA